MKTNLAIINALLFILFTACTPEEANISLTQTLVEGTVLNSKTNKAIADATVYVRGFNTAKGEPPYFHPNRTDDLIAKVKTDTNGRYSITFDAKSDSSYRVIAIYNDNYYAPNKSGVQLVKPNEKQSLDFKLCEAAFIRILYFNDKKLITDSVNFVSTLYRPCEGTITQFDDSPFLKNLLASSISEPNPEGVSGTISNYWAEDNKEATIKWTRLVNGKVVQTVEKILKPRIGNAYPRDTIHVVF